MHISNCLRQIRHSPACPRLDFVLGLPLAPILFHYDVDVLSIKAMVKLLKQRKDLQDFPSYSCTLIFFTIITIGQLYILPLIVLAKQSNKQGRYIDVSLKNKTSTLLPYYIRIVINFKLLLLMPKPYTRKCIIMSHAK